MLEELIGIPRLTKLSPLPKKLCVGWPGDDTVAKSCTTWLLLTALSPVSTDSEAVRLSAFCEGRIERTPFRSFSVAPESKTKSASLDATGVFPSEQSLTTGLLSAWAVETRLKQARALALMKDTRRDMIFPIRKFA
jgi:hypothetical protein